LLRKGIPYEESIRVPLYIHLPETKNPQSSSRLVINNDLAPTIADLARAEPNISVDGLSLVPLLSNPDEEKWRDKFLLEHPGHLTFSASNGIRTASSVYIQNDKGINEFYNLEADPFQLNNIYNSTLTKNPEKISILEELLVDLKTCGNGTCQILEGYQYN